MSATLNSALARAVDAGITFRPPADEMAIRRLEELIGRSLPEDLRAFYALHDGAQCIGVAAHEDVLSVAEVMEDWAVLRDVWATLEFHTPALWNPAWIPITSNGGGDYLVLDTDATGMPVRRYWRSDTNRDVVAVSFVEWFASVEWTPGDD